MIKNIVIENFRCFRKTSFKGFARVNLIGGKNNSGKTALLEAIFLNTSPRTGSIDMLRRFRKVDSSFMKQMPERAWNNLFFDKSLRNAIITVETDSGKQLQLNLRCDESIEEFLNVFSDEEEDTVSNHDFEEIRELLTNRESTRSTLHLDYSIDDKKDISATMIAHNKGLIGKNYNVPDVNDVFLIPSSLSLGNRSLSEEFGKADLNGQSEKLLQAFQIIDKDIEAVKTINVGYPSLYIKSKGEDFKPIGLYGDAISKVSNFILKIVNSKNSILLIDEIENGIHTSAQTNLWEKIFDLAEEFNTQIFATTHSIEMIKSFNQLIKEKNLAGRYHELFRHHKTNEITTNTHSPSTLSFEIENNMSVRGE